MKKSPKIRRGKRTPNKTLFWGNGGEWSNTSKWSSATNPGSNGLKSGDMTIGIGNTKISFVKAKKRSVR